MGSDIWDDLNPRLNEVLVMTNCLENGDKPLYERFFWNAAAIFLTAL